MPRSSPVQLAADSTAPFRGVNADADASLRVCCELYADHVPLAMPQDTSQCARSGDKATWDEWLTFPVPIAELPLSSQLVVTVWDTAGPSTDAPLGGATLSLFGKHGYVPVASRRS